MDRHPACRTSCAAISTMGGWVSDHAVQDTGARHGCMCSQVCAVDSIPANHAKAPPARFGETCPNLHDPSPLTLRPPRRSATAMASIPLLQLNEISLTFGGDPVFHDLSLVVQPGDRVALVGRNGSGKSTLMKVMAGLVEADQRRPRRVSPVHQRRLHGTGSRPQRIRNAGCDYAMHGLGAVRTCTRSNARVKGLKFDPDRLCQKPRRAATVAARPWPA